MHWLLFLIWMYSSAIAGMIFGWCILFVIERLKRDFRTNVWQQQVLRNLEGELL